MTTRPSLSGYSIEVLHRMRDALQELRDCLNETSPDRPEFAQMHELLSLWQALQTEEDREETLALLRSLAEHRRH